MPNFLKEIVVENFKSFYGKISIGPLQPFTAVIGPNGSGKSNFMDAVSFVMGEKTNKLRVKRLSELIHGSINGKPISDRASVTAVFTLESGTEIRFQRSVHNSSSEHRINGAVVSCQEYLDQLYLLGINVKANNFFVFQGSVEDIALMNSDELTRLLEEISTSGELKPEYDRLKTELVQAEKATQFAFQKKKGIAADRKVAKIEKQEAQKFHQLRDEYVQKNVELHLFHLYHIEKKIGNFENELEEKRQELAVVDTEKEREETLFKERKKEGGMVSRELAKLEQDFREAEVAVMTKRPQFLKTKENVAYLRRKVETAQKSLDQARRTDEAHKKDVRELEEELARVEEAKAAYETSVNGPSLIAESCNVILEAEQIRQYNRLKEEASTESARHLQRLDSITREKKSEQDKLDNEMRKKTDIEEKIKQKTHMQQAVDKRLERLEGFVKTSQAQLNDLTKQRDELQTVIGNSKENVHCIQREMETICAQLGDATLGRNQVLRDRKKAEVVEILKDMYPGVKDRILTLCKPIHKRYNVAVTKVLGRMMDAIVVDTEKTARNCIQYLKSALIEPETFLPLDYIQPKPLKERLRSIDNPPNVKLIYDVLNFHPKSVERAILYVTRNTLVCETVEDANHVAYDMEPTVRYDCVALDGTYFQRSGIISGGTMDLHRRAKRWDEKEMSQLKLRQDKLTEDLRESMLQSRKESELTNIEVAINGLISRLRYSNADIYEAKTDFDKLKVEVTNLQSEREKLDPAIATIEKTIAERDEEIQKIEESINSLEDRIFNDFCKRIGVSNIRQYEERELRAHQEHDKRRMDFDNQCNRILTQLDFEKKRDTESNIRRWQKVLEDAERKLEWAKQAEIDLKAEMGDDEVKKKELETAVDAKRVEVKQNEEEIAKWRRAMQAMSKNILKAQRYLNTIEMKIEREKARRHAILIKCKMEGIMIPILEGNLEDVSDSYSTNDDRDTSQEQFQPDSEIKIDFSLLTDESMELEDEAEVDNIMSDLKKSMNDLNRTIERIRAPNMKADENFCSVVEKLRETNDEFQETCQKARKITAQFDKVKNERHDRFMRSYEHVAKETDSIYKALVKNRSAQAYLETENPEEPYLAGITFNCVAPGKRFQTMSNLSGGEKTVAALALLFAINSLQPSPFFLLDEIDASMDNTNINKVANYIREKSTSIQMIVISLKLGFFCKADAIIGISPAIDQCLKSEVLILDLKEYELSDNE